MRAQRMVGFMFREKWSHFLPEFIADLPLVARHTSPSKIAIIYDLTIPFGIGSNSGKDAIFGGLKGMELIARKVTNTGTVVGI